MSTNGNCTNCDGNYWKMYVFLSLWIYSLTRISKNNEDRKVIMAIVGESWLFTIQHNAIQYDTIRYDTIRYNNIYYDTILYYTIQYDTIRYDTIRYDTMRCDAM